MKIKKEIQDSVIFDYISTNIKVKDIAEMLAEAVM